MSFRMETFINLSKWIAAGHPASSELAVGLTVACFWILRSQSSCMHGIWWGAFALSVRHHSGGACHWRSTTSPNSIWITLSLLISLRHEYHGCIDIGFIAFIFYCKFYLTSISLYFNPLNRSKAKLVDLSKNSSIPWALNLIIIYIYIFHFPLIPPYSCV